ncbi:ABC-2 transporter permease [Evansella tamaricis]|uniref:ABC-2 transporter permease n=1 Tax=Evansella tamaricis TaxID=2069301 RepID=A0ABS6JJH1_9BACI|nr:ABC-2 transporter permease [Evansella tamaricis]MBU9713349.1 ABC-2 transporter permease [Evansella tamaricis]
MTKLNTLELMNLSFLRGIRVIPLIKRDILSTKNVWLFVILAVGGVWAFIYYFTLTRITDLNDFLVIPGFVIVFLGYGLVAHICRVEDLNRVNKRMIQLPVDYRILILSRYGSSFLLIGMVLLANCVLYFLLYILAGSERVQTGNFSNYFFIVFHLLLVIISIYIPFYFSKNSNVATWGMRISTLVWLIYMFFLPSVYFQWTHQQYVPEIYYERLGIYLTLVSIVVLILSYYISLWCYRLKWRNKGSFLPLGNLVICIAVLFMGAAKLAEVNTFTTVKNTLHEIKVEGVHVEAFPTDTVDGLEQYRIFIFPEFSSNQLSLYRDWQYVERGLIIVTVTGTTSDYLGLHGFSIPMETAFSLGSYRGIHDGREHFVTESEAPVLLSEEEKKSFLTHFDESDFIFELESRWLDGKIEMDWIQEDK